MPAPSPLAPVEAPIPVTDAELAACHRHAAEVLADVEQPVLLVSEHGRITYLNPIAERVFAAKPLVGRDLSCLFPPERSDDHRRLSADLSESARVRGLETTLLGRTGEVPVRLTARRIEHDGDVAGFALVVRDLRESREIKRQLLRADRLATIGLLASSVAHEVGTPLSIILGRAELLGELVRDNPAAHRQTEAITNQISRISDVVARLLTFSRETGTGTEAVNLNRVIEEVVSFVEPRIREIDVKLDLQSELPVMTGNPGHFYQVFLNLVMNAVDAMPEGGTLELTTSACQGANFAPPELDLSCHCVQAFVKDTGVGISPETAKRIFEPFYTTKGLSKGTGLGLAIAEEIVGRYGGQLQVESKPGAGSQFLVNLPLSPRSLQVVR